MLHNYITYPNYSDFMV